MCTFHIKKASELERCEGWWQAIEKGINKKKFSICKIFSHPNINKKKENENREEKHEKMSHSAMH